MMTLLLAGHETTAASLAWAMHQLALHPEATRAARDELARMPEDADPASMHTSTPGLTRRCGCVRPFRTSGASCRLRWK